MSSGVIWLITVSLSGCILFLITILIERLFGERYLKYVYVTMKLILVFFLIPVSVIVYKTIWNGVEKIPVEGEDFHFLISGNFKIFDIITPKGNVINLLILIWFIGFVIFYVVSTFKGVIFIRRLVRRSVLVKDKEILDVVEKLKKEIKINQNIKIYQSVEIISPFLTGTLHPKIVIPKTNSSINTKEKMELALRHEFIHLKSYDIPFKMLLNLVQKIHWFNPVLYVFAYRFCNISEFVCDQKVIEGMEKSERRSYAELLLSVSKEKTKAGELVSALRGDTYKFMERRVYQIMRYKKQKISVKFIMALALLAISSPVVTYASSKAILNLDNKIVNYYEENYFIEEEQISEPEYVEEGINLEEAINLELIQTRGVNSINATLSPKKYYTCASVSLKKGAVIAVSTMSDKASDQYRVGYIVSGKGTYVNSNQGVINHTFTVPSDGVYDIYCYNSGSSSVHIKGSINTR